MRRIAVGALGWSELAIRFRFGIPCLASSIGWRGRPTGHSPIHGTHPNSGGVERTVAITPRFANGTKQSGDTMPRGVLASPNGSGREAFIMR